MKRIIAISATLFLLVCGLSSGQTANAQTETTTTKEGKFFRLDFVVKEIDDGKIINSRNYATDLQLGGVTQSASIRTGSKVPVPSGSSEGQYTYIDVGINFDCHKAELVGNNLDMDLSAEISSYVPVTEPSPSRYAPVIRQNRWNSQVMVPLRKPTTVFSSDDLTSKRKLQVEVTATPIMP